MKLESDGILISIRPFDERNVIAHIFSRDFGVVAGMIRGAAGMKNNRPLVGQFGNFSWNARLDSALGVFHWEPERNMATHIMINPQILPFMNSAFDLIKTLLAEREPYPTLYNDTIEMLRKLPDTQNAPNTYQHWEINLLRELGYALDLTHCAGCGKTSELGYISPKTGRAVCTTCATPYTERLYKLPITLNTTLRFLENVCAQQDVKIPQFRAILSTKFF